MKLIECVPNFSEGRDPRIVDLITREISATPGAVLLDVDRGSATNRTVVTLAGPPAAVEDAAFRAIARAAELIDMRKHSGEHARMGATDVCPFVPMQGTTMEECVESAQRLAQRVGQELRIPTYLYGAAARRPERVRLPDIRKGEYEALEEKLKRADFAPDFGPAEFNARSGATAIGARPFLIAWNVNLNTRDHKLAEKIAAELRETGKLKRDRNGEFVRDAQGQIMRTPGRFTELQGGGWYIEEYGRAQISFNLMNYQIASLHAVFDACREVAATLGVRVTGSELVGLLPLEALLQAGDHYLEKQGRTTGVPERERIHTAVMSLGLDDLTAFDPAEKIIEYKYRGALAGLKAMTIHDFADLLSSDSPAPGGGSVAALCGSMSAALTAMVAALTWGKKEMQDLRPRMKRLGDRAQQLKQFFVVAIDADTDAFNEVLAARRLPRGSDAEKAARLAAIEAANQRATQVPQEVLTAAVEALELALQVARDGMVASLSDAGVGAACALAAAEGAALNVRTNIGSLTDRAAAVRFAAVSASAVARARELALEAREVVDQRMTEPS